MRCGTLVSVLVVMQGVWGAVPTIGFAEDTLEAIRNLPVWYDGRAQRLQDFSQTMLDFIAGPKRMTGSDPVLVVLSMMANPAEWHDQPLIWLPSPAIRKAAGVSSEKTHLSYLDLQQDTHLDHAIVMIVKQAMRHRNLASLDRELLAVHARWLALHALLTQDVYLVPPPIARKAWAGILTPSGYPDMTQVALKRTWAELLAAVREEETEVVEERGTQLAQLLGNLGDATQQSSIEPPSRERWHLASPLSKWHLGVGGQQF